MATTVICAGSFSMIFSCALPRHCEEPGAAASARPDDKLRDEAIQKATRQELDCFVARAPRNDALAVTDTREQDRWPLTTTTSPKEDHPRDRAGPLSALGRGTDRAHRAAQCRDRSAERGDGEEALVKGCRRKFFQDVTYVSRARCGILHAASQNRDPGCFPCRTGAPALQRTALQGL